MVPAGAWAQDGEEASVWQFAMRDVEWEAVERLQQELRDYRKAGAIGSFELLIQTNETRLDTMVTAEIVDAFKLAELRGVELTDPGRAEHGDPVSRNIHPAPVAFRPPLLDPLRGGF